MSKSIQLAKTPESNPELYDEIPASKARKGDYWRGKNDPDKWYRTQGGKAIDSWRKYWRRRKKAKKIASKPVARRTQPKARPARPSRPAPRPKVAAKKVPFGSKLPVGSVYLATGNGEVDIVLDQGVVNERAIQAIRAGLAKASVSI